LRQDISLEEANAAVGGGALPEVNLPTVRLVVKSEFMRAEEIDSWLRGCKIPIVGLLDHGRFLLDLRTIL